MDDPISKQVAIDELPHGIYEFFDICENDDESSMTYNNEKLSELINKGIEKRLKGLLSAQTERKTGHWYDVGSLSCRCSECGCKSQKKASICPCCGAKMEGE